MKIAVLGGGNGSFAAAGDFALQGHDPGSETHYKNIKVKPLPDKQ